MHTRRAGALARARWCLRHARLRRARCREPDPRQRAVDLAHVPCTLAAQPLRAQPGAVSQARSLAIVTTARASPGSQARERAMTLERALPASPALPGAGGSGPAFASGAGLGASPNFFSSGTSGQSPYTEGLPTPDAIDELFPGRSLPGAGMRQAPPASSCAPA